MKRMYSKKQILELVKSNPEAVIKALLGQDINVNGITSKGIANTGNIANTGDIANIGKITGGEILENMSGYGAKYADNTPGSSIYNPTYCSIVKTGNKLTLALAGTYTRPSENPPLNPTLIEFIIPKAIYDKLYPMTSFYISSKLLHYFDSVSSTGKDLAVSLGKRTETIDDNTIYKLVLTAYSVHSSELVATTPYMFRYEETFLLGENLLPQE